MVPIIKEFIPAGRRNRPAHPMVPLYLTIHDTGNDRATANARNHSHWVRTNPDPDFLAGWHFTVDDQIIIQQLPLGENAWHASDGANGTGNRASIAIEICENQDGDRAQAEENAAWLAAKLIREVPSLLAYPQCLKRHYDWNIRHLCPRVLLGRPNGWTGFISQVRWYLEDGAEPPGGEGGEETMLERAIIINGCADFSAVEPLARRLEAPIILRGSLKQIKIRELYIAGGGATGVNDSEKLIDLSGKNRYETANNIYNLLKQL